MIKCLIIIALLYSGMVFKTSTFLFRFVLFPSVVTEINLMLERNSRDILTLMALVCGIIAKYKTTKMKSVYHGFIAL